MMKLVTAALLVTFTFVATQVHAGGDDTCFSSCQSECLNDGHTSKSVCKTEYTAECGSAPRDIPPPPVCTLQHNPAYDACIANDYAWFTFCFGFGVVPYCYSCKRLALGEKDPDIVSALADLGKYKGDTKQTVTQLKKDYNAWLAGARKVREMTIQDHAEVREVMCRQGVDEEDITKKANAVADRWASQISSAYGTLLGQSDRLTDRALADKLKKYKGAREVAEGLRANRATLDKIKSSDLQGSNNPKIKVRMKYGTDYHASWSCSGNKEFKIDSSYCSNPIRSGSGCAADCVVPGSSCEVIELKPKNDEAVSMGTKQKDAYEAGLRTWFTKNKDELLSKYPNVSACIKDGQISMKSRIETYNFCPDDPKDLGEELNLSSDVSESD